MCSLFLICRAFPSSCKSAERAWWESWNDARGWAAWRAKKQLCGEVRGNKKFVGRKKRRGRKTRPGGACEWVEESDNAAIGSFGAEQVQVRKYLFAGKRTAEIHVIGSGWN